MQGFLNTQQLILFQFQVQILKRILLYLNLLPQPPLTPVILLWYWMLSPPCEERCSSSKTGIKHFVHQNDTTSKSLFWLFLNRTLVFTASSGVATLRAGHLSKASSQTSGPVPPTTSTLLMRAGSQTESFSLKVRVLCVRPHKSDSMLFQRYQSFFTFSFLQVAKSGPLVAIIQCGAIPKDLPVLVCQEGWGKSMQSSMTYNQAKLCSFQANITTGVYRV